MGAPSFRDGKILCNVGEKLNVIFFRWFIYLVCSYENVVLTWRKVFTRDFMHRVLVILRNR